MNNKLKTILINIDFVGRYKKLSESNQFADNTATLKSENTISLVKEMGYTIKYIKKDGFYKLLEEKDAFRFQFNISLKYGNVELIWGIWKNETPLDDVCGPFGVICKAILGTENRPLMPKYRNYDDLKGILKEAFNIYEDFKEELIREEKKI